MMMMDDDVGDIGREAFGLLGVMNDLWGMCACVGRG